MFHSPWDRRIQRTSKVRSPIRSRRPGWRRATLRVEELEARILLNAANDQYVSRLYDDLLERPADPSGLQAWNALLDQGTSRIQVAEGFLGSKEQEIQLIGNMYESLLKRAPDLSGLSGSLQFLQTGGRSDQLEAIILGSLEYFGDTGTSANSFLGSLYHDVLGRPIDPSGLALFTSALQTGATPTQVARAVVDSPEARGIQVNSLYVRFLDRDADSSGLRAFVNALGQGARPEVIESAILGSSEYFNDFVATPGPPVTDRSALAVPGTTGQTVTATFTASGVSTAYANEFGIFPVDDAMGRIGTLKPGDPGYEAAALNEPGSRVVFAQPPIQGQTTTVNLAGGSFLGLYLVPNGTTAEAKATNPNNQLGQLPFVYFSSASANPDRFEHIHQTGNRFAFEDLFGGGDRDFNDLVVTVAFSQPPPLQTDHTPPVVKLTSPPNGLEARQNPIVSGTATDDQSGVASVEAEVDGGSLFPVSFDSTGNFSFPTSLSLHGSADGVHKVDVRATDKAGNVSSFVSTTFTLDTIAPTIQISDPTSSLTTGHNVTITGEVTDKGSGVAQIEDRVDGGAFTPLSFDASGNFSFTTSLPLDGSADGQHTVAVQATDRAGNVSALTTYRFVLHTSSVAGGGTTLVEGTRFATPFQQTFTVPSQPSELQFAYDNLDFDTSAHFIKDAFEASLTDSNGNSLVLPISTSQNTFLNITEGQAPIISQNVQLNNGTVDVDLSHITPGTQATLTVRLVNNDSDTRTTVHISDPQIIAATMNTPAAVTPAVTPPVVPERIDFSGLSDVSTSVTAVYGETSLNRQTNVLLVGLAVQNTGSYPVDAPLVAVITNLSDPSVRVLNSDGLTPGGLPYFDLSGFIGGHTLGVGQSTTGRTLSFYDPNGIQFTYVLQILGQLNRPPTFTSTPNTEAIPGQAYLYQATASDPDNDALTFSLLAGPAGMSVDPTSGKVTWSPQTSDLGNQSVLLQVADGRGGTAQQQYTISTIVAPPNRPPVFTSTPVVVGNVNAPYAYQATAVDPDDDPVSYSLGNFPVAVAVTNPSFEAQVVSTGFATSSIPGWTITSSGGTFNPGPGEFTNGVPDGQNVAFGNGGTIAQVLTEPLAAGTRYVLQVDVGHRQNVSLAHFSVELWAGGFLAGASSPTPAAGAFATVTVTYDAPANSPLLGQPLEIRLISSGTQVCFDNVRLSAAASAAISGMAINSATGLVTWTPSIHQLGPQAVAVQASDGRGGVALQTYTVNVLQDPANQPPQIVSQPVTEIESPLPAPNAPRQTIDFEGLPAAPSFIEGSTIPLADTLSDQLLQTDGVTFRSGSGVPYIAVVTLGLGHATSGTNGIGGMSSATILDYATPIIAEFFLPSDATTPAATDFVSIRADNIGDRRTVSLEGYDANGQLLATTSAVDVGGETLTLATPGIHSIKVLGTSTTAFDDLTFAQLDAAPAYRYDVKAIDHDGDTLTYSLTTAPPRMVIDSATGVITWSPPVTPESDPVTVRVDDGRGGFDTQSFKVVVDQAGTGQIQGTAFDDLDASGSRDPMEPPLPGRLIYLDLNHNGIHDADEPSETTDANGAYSFANLTPAVYTVAMEGQSGSRQTLPATDTYVVTVNPQEVVSGIDFGATTISSTARPPVISSTAPTVAAGGQPFRYAVAVRNPDGVALQFDLPVAPEGMSVDADTGVIAWTPNVAQVGSQSAIVRLRDARGDVVLQAFQILVSDEAPPIITSTPQNPAVTLQPYQYQVVAQDAENDPLTYSLVDEPVGMTIDSGTGVISWVGAAIGGGLPVQFPVTVQVSDGRGGQDTQSYMLLVVADTGDRAPVINSPPDTSVALGHNYFYAVQATDPDGDPLAYDLPTAPAGMTIDAGGVIRWTPAADQFGPNDVTVRVQDGRGGEATQSFTVNVTSQPNSQPPRITSAPPLAATLGHGYAYDATGVDADGSPLVWSLQTAPAGMSIDPMRGKIRWSPTVEQLGSQQVMVGVTNGDGLSTTQPFTIQVRAIDTPPLITSAPPTQGAAGQAYTYAVTATDVDGDPLTYSLTAFAAGLTIDAATGLIQWTPTTQQIGTHIFAVAVDDGQGGTATQNWLVVIGSQPLNQPPIITSIPPLAAGLVYQYQVVATDPEGAPVSFSLLQSPAGMTIDSASGLIQWTPTAAEVGTNNVTVAASDPQGARALQNFSIVVLAINHPPTITSTPPTTAVPGMPFHYDVHALDPDGDNLVYSLTTAPTGMAIDSLGRINWSPQAGDIGSQPVAVSVSDGRGGRASQQFTLTVGADTEAPQINLTLSANPADLGAPNFAVVTASDNVGVVSLALTMNGTAIPLDSMGRATLPDDTAGVFNLVATASDAAGNVGTNSQTLKVINPQVTNAPIVAISTPADNNTVTAPTQVIGTVQDPNLVSYTLSVAPMGSNSFTTFFTGTSQVSNGVLGTFDPTMLQNGSYDLRLVATNTGGVSSVADDTVDVSGNFKLGDFKVSYTDLTVPMAGVPITVTRTYDSLTANESGDFGYGWRLEFRDTQLQTSVPSTGYEGEDFFNPFQFGSHVYITLPGRLREGFTFEPAPAPGLLGGFLGVSLPAFVPDPGVKDTLTVPSADLAIASNGTLQDYSTGLPYNPASPIFGNLYTLTTSHGVVYNINASSGEINNVSTANNDTLTFTDAGVTSSSGEGITFQRDAQGRIAGIVDPMGKKILYQYDAAGDLLTVTEQANNTTQFVYLSRPAHYLSQVIDPLGRTGIRTDYGANGRLDEIIDPNGNAVKLKFDVGASTQTVTDQLGNTTTHEYDARGNEIAQIDPLGGVTLQTYDANNNLLTETDPLGRKTSYTYDARGDMLTETDPLGNTTINTYQAFTHFAGTFTRLASTTDPLGNTTNYSYDSLGDLIAHTDPIGNTITTSYNDEGNPTVITDPLGNVTTDAYDANGNRTQLIDADGHVTKFTYDADGNLLSQTQADGSGWRLSYNADGKPTSISPIGLPTTFQYNAASQVTQITEPNGKSASLSYDDLDDMTQVTLPDGTTAESNIYDAVGNLVATTDSLGNVTRYTYDADNRRVQTTYPDGSTEKDTYDLAGELVTVTDALGNTTRYVYDADGRQIQTIDALGGITSTQYDAAGRTVAKTDALGRTTRYHYDADGRQIATIAPDGSTTRNIYDADGRLVQAIDAAGNVTTNAYDPSGKLISVTDALGNLTGYQYNDNGGKAGMTDAKGNVTRYSYDTQGHLVQTTLPDGETSRSTYNSSGELASSSNGDGQTIQYSYNIRGEQTSLTLPDGSQEAYTYTSDGLIGSVTDASGTTTYDYDPLTRRLVRVTEPDGRYIRYAYDVDGNRTLMADSLGAGQPEDVTQYAFDALGRVVKVTDPQGGITTYAYDVDGNVIKTTLPNDVTETDTYDTLNRLTAIVDQNSSGETISSFSYTLDANGNRARETDVDGSKVVYAYDALNRVTSETHFSGSGVETGAELYSYDVLGNVIARSGTLLGNATFSYNGDNQLLSGAGSTYAYDGAGNLASVTDSTGAVTRYGYDARGRLITLTAPDGTTTSYTYDFQGVRQSQQGPGGLDKYLVDELFGAGSAQLVREIDSTGATLRSYVIGLDVISMTEGGNASYYLTDALGSTRLLANQTGAVTDTYSYSAYGVLLVHTGSSGNPYLFAAQQQDGSGLLYLRARYYDPNTARFLSQDALPGFDQLPLSLNKYLYCLANPVNGTDPSGNVDADIGSEAVAEAGEAEEDEAESEYDDETVQQGLQLIGRFLQFDGGLLTLYAAEQALENPYKLGAYFGGYRSTTSISSREILGKGSAIPLGLIGGFMEFNVGTTKYKPAAEGTEPEVNAYVYSGLGGRPRQNSVFLGPGWYENLPVFASPDDPLAHCRIGSLIHEFAHLATYGKIGDTRGPASYGELVLFFRAPEALLNADNYRLAVQGVVLGFHG
jgi:RHS repeat-associated protein